jgi:inosine-uridine nucleoside N-ribohydrolase
MMSPKIPVILDTDIGSDIDDTWALAFLLRSPELDLKLVVSDTGDTVYRAKLNAKLLEVAGCSDIPLGIGLSLQDESFTTCYQSEWVKDYDLARYPGKVYADGVAALIETIMTSQELVTLLCIGPLPNIAAALEREPRIVNKARFVGMHGSLRRGYLGSPNIHAEYNVRLYPQECRKVFEAAWDMTITPLDTCGVISLQGEKYRRVLDSQHPLTRAVLENYRLWHKACTWADGVLDPQTGSSTLFDAVAAYLCFSEELLVMERVGVRVSNDGFTLLDENAKKINCATDWKDLRAFEDLLVARLV